MADTTYYVRVKYDLHMESALHKLLEFSKRLVELQSQAESVRVALATMLTGFGAPGFANGARDFEKAMGASAVLMQQIRKDAAVLPGTAEELMEVVRAAMPSGIQTGHAVMGQNSILKMSERLLASSDLLKIPGGATTVAREFQALMEGRAQGRNDLFARMRGLMPGSGGGPISAKEFNQLTETARWEKLDTALKRLVDPALPTYAKTWRAISDTTTNWVQQIARVATGGAFDALKKHLFDLNQWFDKNQDAIEKFASTIGEDLTSAVNKAFGFLRDTFAFIVENRETLIKVAQAYGAIKLMGSIGGGPGIGGGIQGALGGAGLGMGVNLLTGGAFDMQGVFMGLAGALMSFGGALGAASAAALAFGAAMNMIDPERKKDQARLVEASSIFRAVPEDRYDADSEYMNAPGGIALPGMGRAGKGGKVDYNVLKSIINEQKLLTRPGGPLDETALENYLAPIIKNPLYKQHVKDAFDVAAATMGADWRANTAFGPAAPTAEQKMMQLLYEKGKVVPEKPKVDVNVTINQDISQAEDPERILVRTKEAIEDALIRPIESGNNRFSVLR